MPHHTTSSTSRSYARSMRSNQTKAEAALWNRLRNWRLMGLKFKRQMPIDCYIVDFICAEHRLIVEVDGSRHVENDYDEKCDTELAIPLIRQLRCHLLPQGEKENVKAKTIVFSMERLAGGRIGFQHLCRKNFKWIYGVLFFFKTKAVFTWSGDDCTFYEICH